MKHLVGKQRRVAYRVNGKHQRNFQNFLWIQMAAYSWSHYEPCAVINTPKNPVSILNDIWYRQPEGGRRGAIVDWIREGFHAQRRGENE